MKKSLFFMIFIFTTAICGYAQEAPAAEQNDDSELILRYQNRRTMRGYKMLFEAGYQWGLPDKEGFLCGVYDPDKWSVGASAGFQFNKHLYFGGGIGFNSFFCDGTTRLVVPIFGELRCNFLNRRTTPFVCGRYGYGFGKIHGSYDSLVLGMRLALKNNHSLTAGVEYSVQLDIGDNDYSQTNIGFRLGYEF